MIVKEWGMGLVNGEGYAQYLATKHNKKVNLYEIDYGRGIKDNLYYTDEEKLPEEFIRAVDELWSLLDDADAHKFYDGSGYYETQKSLPSRSRNVFALCEMFITKEIAKVLKNTDDEYFGSNAYYVAVDDDYVNISKAMMEASDIINNIGKGMFWAHPKNEELKEVSPRKNDVKDSKDEFGNTYEIGDLVAYGTRVSMICGVMNCKLLIANGDRVDKGSCTIIRKANGKPLKYGVFG
jgi:hypothetical protein